MDLDDGLDCGVEGDAVEVLMDCVNGVVQAFNKMRTRGSNRPSVVSLKLVIASTEVGF